jgi:hypothetical protein
VSGGSRTRLSTLARWCLGCSATDTLARTEGVEPSASGLEPDCSPGSTSLSITSCPGRTRTCTPPVNNRPHNRSCFGTITVPAAGVEPAASAVSARRSHHLSYTGSLFRASGGTRTHFVRLTRAVPGPSSIAGIQARWPVGVEPTHPRFTAGARCRFGFRPQCFDPDSNQDFGRRGPA